MLSTPLRWIDRPATDLPWFILSALAGWAVLGLYLGLGVGPAVLYWVWILALDGPHLFATLARTYLDREEWRVRRRLLLGSLSWVLLPAGTLLYGAATGDRLPWFLFLAFAQVWAYWHVIRQHYGFLVIYQRRGGEP